MLWRQARTGAAAGDADNVEEPCVVHDAGLLKAAPLHPLRYSATLQRISQGKLQQQQRGAMGLRTTPLICALMLGSAVSVLLLGLTTLSLTGTPLAPARLSLLMGTESPAGEDAVADEDGDAAQKGLLTWDPRPGRFLLAYCFHGQMSNRLLCLRNHALLAGLLNRTLLVAFGVQEQVRHAYDLRLVWDLQRTRACLGQQAVMTTDEFRAKYAERVWPLEALRRASHGDGPRSVAVHCWRGPPEICGFDDPWRSGDVLCPLAVGPDRAEAPPPGEDQAMQIAQSPSTAQGDLHLQAQSPLHWMLFGNQSAPRGGLRPLLSSRNGSPVAMKALCMSANQSTTALIQRLYRTAEDILVVGDLADKLVLSALVDEGREHPFRMRTRQGDACSWSLLRPPTGIMSLGRSIVRGMMSGEHGGAEQQRFLSVHWRRGDFISYCHVAKQSDSCTYAPEQAARCMLRKAAQHNLTRIFIATNADDNEIIQLRKIISGSTQGQVEVHLLTPAHLAATSVARGIQLLPGVDIEQQNQLLLLTLEKAVAAQASVFLGSVWSTFTQDIQSMRSRLQRGSPADAVLCSGEVEISDEGLPAWMVQERKMRRWKRAFLSSPGLTAQEQLARKHIAEVFSWLHYRSWKGLEGLPKWYMQDQAWRQWQARYALEKGISERERSERQWILHRIRDMEAITSGTMWSL